MARPLNDIQDRTEADETQNPRRAGLRPDERDPDEPAGPPGSAGGEENVSGTPGGGLAAGGLAGSNAPSGAVDDQIEELSDAFGDGTQDVSGIEEVAGDAPYAGPSGGAVGGTPSEKRATGGRIPPGEGVVPQGDHAGDSTIGKEPSGPRKPAKELPERHRGEAPAGSTDTSDQ